MQKKEKSIQINAILNIIKQCCVIVFPLITYPYVTRVLGSMNLGRYSFSESIIQYFISLATLGVPTYAIREAARIRENKEELTKFASEMLSISLFSMLISYLVLIALVAFVPRLTREYFLIAILSINVISYVLGRDWINTVFEDFLYLTVRYIFIQTLSVIAILFFVKDSNDYVLYTFIMALSYSANYLLSLFYTRKYVPYRITFHLNLKKHIKPILYLFCITIATTIYVKSDITILGFFRSDGEVGVYTLASNVYTVIKSLLNAVIIVAIPRLSVYLGNQELGKFTSLLSKLRSVLYTLIIPSIVGIIFLSQDIMTLLGGKSYTYGYTSLIILCFSLFFAVFACFYAQGVLISNRKEKDYFYATIISAGLNIILNLFLVPYFGINGAAFTTVLAEATVMFICRHSSLKFIDSFETLHILPIIVGCGFIGGACIGTKILISNMILRIIVSIFLSVLAYFVILLIGKNENALIGLEYIKKYLHKLKRKNTK